MIIKGQARGRAVQLAAHLLSAEQNESIRLYECRGTLAKDVKGALIELEARGLAARSKRPLYHASISPEAATPLDDNQISQAVDVLESRLGLHGQPRVVVVHRKKERNHVHVVWSRVDPESGTAIGYSWNYRLHEKAAREMEAMFGHRSVESSTAMQRRRGSRRSTSGYEQRQAERSGVATAAVTSEVTALWRGSSRGPEFKRKLIEAGYVLARGDRRVFVILDRAGNVHSLARRIDGADTTAIRVRMRDVQVTALPSVADAREQQRTKSVVGERCRKFALASAEVTRRGSGNSLRKTIRAFGANVAAVTGALEENGLRQPVRRGRQGSAGLSAVLYRSARAALFAEYATRLAAARRYLSGDQLVAALAALEAERNAALDALQGARPWRKVREGRQIRIRRLKRRVTWRGILRKPRELFDVGRYAWNGVNPFWTAT